MANMQVAQALANPQVAMAVAQATLGAAQVSQSTGQFADSWSSPRADNIFKTMNHLTHSCMRATGVDLAFEHEDEHEYIVPHSEEPRLLRVRLCIYSGEQLPRERSYVAITLGAGSENERRIVGPLAAESEHPIWEYSLDEEIKVEGTAPRIDFRVFAKRLVGDRLIGSASIRLPPQTMDSPKKQELRLSRPSAMCMPLTCKPPPPAKLTVVWQVCDASAYALDLNRVAEMDSSDMEKMSHSINVKLLKMSLRHAIPQTKVSVTLRLSRLDKDQKRLTRLSPLVLTWPTAADEALGQTMPMELLLECKEACWKTDGVMGLDLEPWVLHESRVTMMSWFLDIVVQTYKEDVAAKVTESGRRKMPGLMGLFHKAEHVQVPTEIGSWREPLSDLMHAIGEKGQSLRFDADMGPRAGVLSLELDIFVDRPHKSIVGLLSDPAMAGMMAPVPVRKGMPPENKWQDRIRYNCSLFADGLPLTRECRPYVRITMGSSGAMTDVKETHVVNNVVWNQPVTIDTKRFYRKATVEIYNCTSGSGVPHIESDLLLGEQTIYDVSVDREYWIHFYGGAMNAPEPDIAMTMVRGGIRPASTYQGSVAVVFGSKRLSKTDFVTKVRSKCEPRRLVVRLHRGVYLDRFKGRKVNVLCQLAGCRMPDAQEGQRLLKAVRFRASKTSVAGMDGANKLEAEQPDPHRFNRNLLSFSGEVDQAGLLSFTHSREPGSPPEPCQWVELCTLRDFPLNVPPDVSHVYLYVVPVGEEKEPPQVFGRLRLRVVAPGSPSAYPPKWQQLRLDRSVVHPLPEAYFPSDLAGYVLGSAALLPAESEATRPITQEVDADLLPEATAAPWCCGAASCGQAPTFVNIAAKGEPSDARCEPLKPHLTQTVYCYVDMLAARELPAMDPDGLMDPSYSIRVLDKEVVHTAGIHKTTSPTFMHRTVIPFEVEVEPGMTPGSMMVASRTPTPPIVVKILDYDKSSSVFEKSSYETVGTVVVKHPASTGSMGQLVHKMMEYDAQKAEANHNGEEHSIGAAPLDLNTMHTAYWYALDTRGRMPFDSLAGGVDGTWHGRPRVLMAVGYSLQEATSTPRAAGMFGKPLNTGSKDGKTFSVESRDKACYQIDVNLLGLRNLPAGLLNPKLYITSFWEGPKVEFDVTSDQDHNFNQDTGPTTDLRLFAEKMKPLLQLKAPDAPDHEDGISFDELSGVRVSAPLYRIPVIPYLQQLALQPGKWRMQGQAGEVADFMLRFSITRREVEGYQVHAGEGPGTRGPNVDTNVDIYGGHIRGPLIEWRVGDTTWKGTLEKDGRRITGLSSSCLEGDNLVPKVKVYEGSWSEPDKLEDPFVLLPAVTFELANAMTGAVYLTLTVGLNRLLAAAGGPQVRSWTEICLEDMAKLKPQLKEWVMNEEVDPTNDSSDRKRTRRGAIQPVANTKVTEDAYMVFVDVFAAHPGFLTWDDDFHLGRPLSDQCLFTVDRELDDLDTEAKVDETAIPQYFNPGDWMFRGYDGPFDMRATPSLHCRPEAHTGLVRRTLSAAQHQASMVLETMSGERPHSKVEAMRSSLRDALKRIEEQLNPPLQPGQRPTKPLGPSTLFRNVLGHCVTKEDLKKMSTHDMKERLHKHGWRATSHLVAPEAEKLLPSQTSLGGENLKDNLHTFMRPVGHVIHPKDRDSRLLARLQMGLPMHVLEDLRSRLSAALTLEATEETAKVLLEEEKRWRDAGKSTLNFMVIKFLRSGIVVWTAPEENAYWGRPGAPLFAVRLLEHPDVVVPVLVPSFDIRRRAETAWYPVKTLKDRFSTLLLRIHRQQRGSQKVYASKKWNKSLAVRQQMRECPSGIDTTESSHETVDTEADPDMVDAFEPDGYSRPIAVAENAFICRIRRRMGGVAFDRSQTKNWYRTALEESFPELRTLAIDADDQEECKRYVLSRFLNVCQPLTAGLDPKGPALLKGHISCKRVADPDYASPPLTRELPRCTAPAEVDPLGRPVENLWIAETVFVRVFVLSAHKLDLGPLGMAGSFNFKPYLTAQLGTDVQHGKVVEQLPAAVGSVNFYQKFVFQATFPGTATMTIDVKHQGLMSDSSVGTLSVDMEDRMLALRRRAFRESSSEQFLVRNIAPTKVCVFRKDAEVADEGWIEPVDPQEDLLYGTPMKPHRGIPEPSPIENLTLVRTDEENDEEGRAGLLRLWIDVTPVGAHLPEDPEVFSGTEFEIRVTVFDASNIKVYRDFGERNDVYVKGSFRSCDYDQNSVYQTQVTDTHKYARSSASFNWNWSFTASAPSSECNLELTLMDADKFGDNDLIYYPKNYSLDHMLWLAYRAHRNGQQAIGSLTDTIIFDRWPKKDDPLPRMSCGCLRRLKRRLKLNKAKFASLKIMVQILPKDSSENPPFTAGRYSEPRGRFSYVNALENPNATARMLLGPTVWLKMNLFVGFWLVVFTVLIIAAMLYYLLSVKKLAAEG